MKVMAGFSLHMKHGDSPSPADWEAIRQAILNDLRNYNLMMCAVTVVSFTDNWDYAAASPETKLIYDLYRFVDGMGQVVKTFKNPGHNSTLNLVLLNPQQLGASTYDF
jgi:hypothetical protein